jgi:tetratricopeptide (TPR) repeat protein
MKAAVPAISFLLVLPNLFSQSQPTIHPPSATGNPTQTIMLTGKVVTEANSPPSESAAVAMECAEREPLADAHSDSKGYFSISVEVSDGAAATYGIRQGKNVISTSQLDSCQLVASLPGYTAEPLHITRGADIGVIHVGTIVLRSVTQSQIFSVSVVSLAPPERAKDAFEKGEEQKRKGKWAAAIASFRKAIAAYPRFALAWLELGRVQAKQSEFADAQQSFHESAATDRLVQIHPEEAEYWFLNSAASFNLGNIKQAETSVTRGMHLDTLHRLPQMEYLYGLILARNQKYASAADHLSAYLKLSPQAADTQNARELLAEFQKRAQASAR